MTSGSWQSTDI